MAHQQDGAVIVGQRLLQEVERVGVEIVGRFVEHDHVGGCGQRLGQQEAVALSARQRTHRLACLLVAEQVFAQVGHHMGGMAAHQHMVVAVGENFPRRLVGIEADAALVDHHRQQVGAELHRAGVGLQFAHQHLEQRRLAGAVGTDQADAVLAKDTRREIFYDDLVAPRLGDVARGDDQCTRRFGRAGLDGGAADRADLVAALLAERVQRPEAAFVSRAAGADALARPFGLALDQPVELVPFRRLPLDDVGRPGLEFAVAAVEAAHDAAIEPQHGPRQRGEEATVVAHQHIGAAPAGELLLQPLDGRQVEVVGRFVEQHHVGFAHQHARQCGAAGFAARQPAGLAVAVELHLLEDGGDAIVGRAQRIGQDRGDMIGNGRMTGEIRLLRQRGDGGAGLGEARAAVEDRLAGQDTQQGRFSRAIAADQRQALTRRDAEIDAIQNGLVAEVEADAAQREKGWVSHRSYFWWAGVMAEPVPMGKHNR